MRIFAKDADKDQVTFEPPKVQEPVSEKPAEAATALMKMPPAQPGTQEAIIDRVVDKRFNVLLRQRLEKYIKDQLELRLGPSIRERMVQLKPDVREAVEEKKEEIATQ